MSENLVCAKAIEMTRGLPGSTYDRRCAVCGDHVCVSLSGQRSLELNPHQRILCTGCVSEDALREVGPHQVSIVPGAREELERLLNSRGDKGEDEPVKDS